RRRAQQDPLGDRQVPHQRVRIGGNGHARLGHAVPQAREHAQDHGEEHDPSVELAALPPGLRRGDAREGAVFERRNRRQGGPLLPSASAYSARITASSGASSIARSRTAPCRSAASTTCPSEVPSSVISSSVRYPPVDSTRTPGSASSSRSVSLHTV